MVVSVGLYATYHLLGEPETTIENLLQIDGVLPPWMRKTAEKKSQLWKVGIRWSWCVSKRWSLEPFDNQIRWYILCKICVSKAN